MSKIRQTYLGVLFLLDDQELLALQVHQLLLSLLSDPVQLKLKKVFNGNKI